ncbi:hypothetical protein [Paracidovorax avenae]|uniref:hypothetical protein n=1 Tax=Paracidovorax avenae TaxID=80867 RepID=UPI00128FB9C9|nr:hypothetical protein [Paracidovorax avenae]
MMPKAESLEVFWAASPPGGRKSMLKCHRFLRKFSIEDWQQLLLEMEKYFRLMLENMFHFGVIAIWTRVLHAAKTNNLGPSFPGAISREELTAQSTLEGYVFWTKAKVYLSAHSSNAEVARAWRGWVSTRRSLGALGQDSV